MAYLNDIKNGDTPSSNVNDVLASGGLNSVNQTGNTQIQPDVKPIENFDIRKTNDAIGEVYKKYEPYYLHLDENQRQIHFNNIKKGFESGQYKTMDDAKVDVENAVVSGMKSKISNAGIVGSNSFEQDLSNYKTLKDSEKEFYDWRNKNKEKQAEDIKSAQTEYLAILNDFNQSKSDFADPDGVINKFKGINDKKREYLGNKPDGTMTEDDVNKIAQELGVSPEEVKNPTLVFQNAELSKEGEQRRGVTKFQNQMADAKQKQDKDVNDAFVKLEDTQKTMNVKLDDMAKQMEQNIQFLEAQGAATGAFRNNAYQVGITNTKNDSLRTIQQLKEMKDKITRSSTEDIVDLTTSYTKAVDRATQDFNQQIKDIKYNLGVKVGGLSEKYGMGNSVLGGMLDKIYQDYANRTEMAFSKTQTVLYNINNETARVTKLINDENERIKKQSDERYNDLIANSGALLMGSSLADLQKEYQSGNITSKRLRDLTSLMTSSVTDTLKKESPYTVITPGMEQEIQHLISIGKTPKEAVRSMQASYKQLEPYNEKLEQARRDYQKSLYEHEFKLEQERVKSENSLKGQTPFVIKEEPNGAKIYGMKDKDGNIVPVDMSKFFSDKINNGISTKQVSEPGKNTVEIGQTGVQCGSAMARISSKLKTIGSSIDEKMALIDTGKDDVAGADKTGLAFVSKSDIFPENGHIGYILKDYGNGKYDVYDANADGKGTVAVRRNVSIPGIVGYISQEKSGIEPTKINEIYLAESSKKYEEKNGMSFEEAKDISDRAATVERLTTDKERKAAMYELGVTYEDINKFKQGYLPIPEDGLKVQKVLYEKAKEMKKYMEENGIESSTSMGTWALDSFAGELSTMSNIITSTLTKENLSSLKGAMSDKDLEFLRAMSSELSFRGADGMPGLSYDMYLKGLDKLIGGIEARAENDPGLANTINFVK